MNTSSKKRKADSDIQIEMADTVSQSFKRTHQFFEILKSGSEISDRTHPIIGALGSMTHAIPPLRLAFLRLANLWQILFSGFVSKTSKLERGVKITLAITAITLAIVAVTVPAIAGILLIVGAGITLLSETARLFRESINYFKLRKEIKKQNMSLKLQKNPKI